MTGEDPPRMLQAFHAGYNHAWLLERHGHRPLAAVCAAHLAALQVAA